MCAYLMLCTYVCVCTCIPSRGKVPVAKVCVLPLQSSEEGDVGGAQVRGVQGYDFCLR